LAIYIPKKVLAPAFTGIQCCLIIPIQEKAPLAWTSHKFCHEGTKTQRKQYVMAYRLFKFNFAFFLKPGKNKINFQCYINEITYLKLEY